MSVKGVYKFYWDCGRSGDLTGVFVATDEQVAKIQGKNIYFGEVLGKHSDISGTIEPGDITLASDDPVAVQIVLDLDLEIGFNPIAVYNDNHYDDEEEKL